MDFLSIQQESGEPALQLSLKEGCISTIVRNLDINMALIMNCTGLFERLHESVTKIHLINTSLQQEIFFIGHITYDFLPGTCA